MHSLILRRWCQTVSREVVPKYTPFTLEEAMATHSNILAWKIPWTEEPGGLQFRGLQRVGHNWAHMHRHTRDLSQGWLGGKENSQKLRRQLFFNIFKKLFIFGCAGSLLWLTGAALHCGVWASDCGGFFCCGAQARGAWAQHLQLMGPGVQPQ